MADSARRLARDVALRVGFDGRALTSPAAGVRRYARGLLEALAQLHQPPDLVMLGGDPAATAPYGAERVAEPLHPPTNAGWMLVGLPLAARRARVDVLHAPAYTAPFWSGVPTVLTIHDVSYARHPEWFPYRRDALRRAFYRRCALSADAIVTDSAFSSSEIRAAYGIDPGRITVVPLGVDAAFAPAGAAAVPLPAKVRPPFVLHVGDLHERRNLAMVLDAVLEARGRAPSLSSLALVLAGVDRGVGDALAARAVAAGAGDVLVRLGPVAETALRALYQHAFALVYPSLYEGFGLPLLEAMACGAPVLASNAASIPEVVGDAGQVLDPHDRAAWTAALVTLTAEPARRAALSAAGVARAREFTWTRTARRTLDVYRTAATTRRRGPTRPTRPTRPT